MDERRKVTILYASETGTAEDLAYNLFDILKRSKLVNIESIGTYDVTKLPDEDIVVLIVSTTGDGEVPSCMIAFWKFLLQKHLSSTSLSSVEVAVFGLGDSSYEKYNAAARRLTMRIKQLGAKELLPLGLGDDQHAHGYFTGYMKWLKELSEILGAPQSALEDDINVDLTSLTGKGDSYRPDPAEYDVEVSESSLDNEVYASIYDSSFPRSRLVFEPPPRCRLKDKTPLYARVVKNDRMTSDMWPQVVKDITLDISAYSALPGSSMPVTRDVFKSWPPYSTGDVATIYPSNPLSLVEKMLSMIYQIDDFSDPMSSGLSEDTFVSIFRNRAALGGGELVRKSRLGNVSCTLLDLFTRYLDIAGPPRRTFFQSLSEHATSEEEKGKLWELSRAEGFSLYHEYVVREKRNYVEVLEEFPSARPPLSRLLQMIPPLQPRHYSIASSPGENPTHVGLCVAVEERRTPYGRRRQGLCSSYLANLRVGDEVIMWLREGSFTDPGPGFPVIMVGPGTGVAPMRSIFRERRLNLGHRTLNTAVEAGLPDTLLFFGCRKKQMDYLYGQEWSSLGLQQHFLESFPEGAESANGRWHEDKDFISNRRQAITTAFSRDGPEEQGKTYVMHKMKLHGELLYELLAKHRAHFFVAGSSKGMPTDVRKALCTLVQEHGQCTEDFAERFVKGLEKSGKYKVEAWSS